MSEIDAIIAQLRVPDLPYPVGRQGLADEPAWADYLSTCWSEQIDATVIDQLRAREDRWSSRQVNSAYLADRIMDVFLRTSGLHFALITRVARLRFYLAWLLHREGEAAVGTGTPLRLWLDHLVTLRGWSGGESRSAKQVFKRLEGLVAAIAYGFQDDPGPFAVYVKEWFAEDDKQQERSEILLNRLLETEQGAARQRAADMQSSHRVAQALDGHQLPEPVLRLLEDQWQGLLRQLVLDHGLDSEPYKRAIRAMDWLIWAMDPSLSDTHRDRLYQVGEELPDRLDAVWQEAFATNLPNAIADPLQQHLVARLRGEAVDSVAAGKREFDPYWLAPPKLPAVVAEQLGHWLVSGQGVGEQRRWLFAFLEASGEVLWTNAQGVKQGLETAESVAQAIEAGRIQALPDPQPFEAVLSNTISGLARVLGAQRKQRELALERARAEAEELRREREATEQRLLKEARFKAQQEAELEASRALAESQAEQVRVEEEQARQAREREQRKAELLVLVDQLHLGGWVEITEQGTPLKLKLAVRINASGKLVFVDRLGLNKREIYRHELVDKLLQNQARLLTKGAEFEDTLSRVVGRIRVGR